MRFANLIHQITAAFADVNLEDGISLREADVIDDYGTEDERKAARAADEKNDWQRIPAEDIAGFPHALCFMDVKGLRFHWPAWMVFTLKHYETSDTLSTDAIVYSICRSAVDHDLRLMLSDRQRDATIGFLQACLELDDWLDLDQVPDALEAWRGDAQARRRVRRRLEFNDAVNEVFGTLVSEDPLLSDPVVLEKAAAGCLSNEQQHEFSQRMNELRQQAIQTVAETINHSGSDKPCYCDGQEICVGDRVQIAVGHGNDFETGLVVAVAGQDCELDNSVPQPDWGFFVEDKNGELVHWDEADEDLVLLNRGVVPDP